MTCIGYTVLENKNLLCTKLNPYYSPSPSCWNNEWSWERRDFPFFFLITFPFSSCLFCSTRFWRESGHKIWKKVKFPTSYTLSSIYFCTYLPQACNYIQSYRMNPNPNPRYLYAHHSRLYWVSLKTPIDTHIRRITHKKSQLKRNGKKWKQEGNLSRNASRFKESYICNLMEWKFEISSASAPVCMC